MIPELNNNDPWRNGHMHARARPAVMGSGINAFRFAGSNTTIVQTRPDQDYTRSDNWQYSRR